MYDVQQKRSLFSRPAGRNGVIVTIVICNIARKRPNEDENLDCDVNSLPLQAKPRSCESCKENIAHLFKRMTFPSLSDGNFRTSNGHATTRFSILKNRAYLKA